MKELIFRIVLISGLLQGCSSIHTTLLDSPQLNSEQRIALVSKAASSKPLQSIALDPTNNTCVSLVECAIHLDDYALTQWLLAHSDHPTYWRNDWGYEHHLIYAPLRADFSDEKTARYLALLLEHNVSANVCDYGKVRPITYAFRKGYIKAYSVLLNASNDLSQSTQCVDTRKYVDHLFKSNIAKPKLTERYNKVRANAYADSPLAELISYFDINEQHQAEMLFLMLERATSPHIAQTRGIYRCGKYSYASALAFAHCENKTPVYGLLNSYYQRSNKFSDSERQAIARQAEKLIKDTPSKASLAEQQRQAREYETKLKAKLDAAFNDNASTTRWMANFASVDSMLNAKKPTFSSRAASINEFDMHLYVEDMGAAPSSNITRQHSFVGETCRRYPWASTCQPKTKATPTPAQNHCLNAEALARVPKGKGRACVE